MSERITSFEDLECWQACRRLRIFIAKAVVPTLPKEERYGLASQILRSARSTTANIAERYGRFHYLDNAKFCSNARGSCFETLDHLITANDEEMIPNELLTEGREHVNEATRILNGYIKSLRRQASSPDNQ
jgi:four helix bundle protein